MKNWQEIKDEYAQEQGRNDWNELVEYYIYWDNGKLLEHIDAVSLLRAKQALENAIIKQDEVLERFAYRTHGPFAESLRESILDDKNIPEL